MGKKKVRHVKTGAVAPEPFNTLIPGPRYKTTVTYTDKSKAKGYGMSRTESKKKAFKKGSGGGCFLTSACVRAMGLGDRCEELETLRAFRDGYLMNLPEGKGLVAEYYEVAPEIVRSIDESPHSAQAYLDLYESLVVPSVRLIREGKPDQALGHYRAVVQDLRQRYLDGMCG